MNARRKIFHLITSLQMGGTERFLVEIVRGLKDRYDMEVAYLKDFGALGEELQALGFKPHRLSGFWELVQALQTSHPDLLHTHLYQARIVGCLAGRWAGVPQILCSRRARDDWRSTALVLLDRSVSRLAHGFVVNSTDVKEVMLQEGFPAEKIHLLPPSLSADFVPSLLSKSEARQKLGWPHQEGPVVGSLTRLHAEKGADFLPDIVERISAFYPQASFYIGGEGPLRISVETDLKRRGLSPHVHFLGLVQDRATFLAALDLFILPSREESFSQALLEAAVAGVPFTATAVGGTATLIQMGAAGTLAPPRDSSAFAAACLTLLKTLPESSQRARNAVAHIQGQASPGRMIEALKKVYEEILS